MDVSSTAYTTALGAYGAFLIVILLVSVAGLGLWLSRISAALRNSLVRLEESQQENRVLFRDSEALKETVESREKTIIEQREKMGALLERIHLLESAMQEQANRISYYESFVNELRTAQAKAMREEATIKITPVPSPGQEKKSSSNNFLSWAVLARVLLLTVGIPTI